MNRFYHTDLTHCQYHRGTEQLKLPGIDFAPEKVRAHGLRDAHSYPLVSRGKSSSGAHSASFRVPPVEAWRFPEIELRAGNSWPSLILDIDGSNALYRIVEAVDKFEILSPNWTVTRKESGGTHAVWNLERPVHRGESARKGPLKALAWVSEFYADALMADSGYCGVLSHNPMSKAHGPGFVTNWLHEDAYSLPQLGEVIPMGWRRPALVRTEIGRNCDLFHALMRWAGKPENIVNDCLAAAHVVNQSFDIPLADAEVAATARSVHKYRVGWITKGKYFTPTQRTLWGRARGIKSGAARRKLTEDRDKAIIQAVSEGRSLRDVGREYGLSYYAVWNIVNRQVFNGLHR